MKRSEINAVIREADAFISDCHFYLPPFANWTVTDWLAKGHEVTEIAEHALGWDITDFGLGDFHNRGLTLFTIRNGGIQNLQTCTGKVYAEKLLIVNDHQITPYHFHWQKVEDIINRGGGRLLLKLYNSTPDERADTTSPVIVSLDGVVTELEAGGTVALDPGMSITLPTGLVSPVLGGRWTLSGRRGFDGQRRPERQQIPLATGALPDHRGRRAALSPARQRLRPLLSAHRLISWTRRGEPMGSPR